MCILHNTHTYIVLGDLCDNIGLVGVSAMWSYVTASPSHHDQAIPILSPLLFMHVGHPYIPLFKIRRIFDLLVIQAFNCSAVLQSLTKSEKSYHSGCSRTSEVPQISCMLIRAISTYYSRLIIICVEGFLQISMYTVTMVATARQVNDDTCLLQCVLFKLYCWPVFIAIKFFIVFASFSGKYWFVFLPSRITNVNILWLDVLLGKILVTTCWRFQWCVMTLGFM